MAQRIGVEIFGRIAQQPGRTQQPAQKDAARSPFRANGVAAHGRRLESPSEAHKHDRGPPCLPGARSIGSAPSNPPRKRPLRMKINGNAIKPGNVIQHDGGLWVAVKTAHVKPGKGGAFAQVELKNLIDGRKLNERFRSSDTVERVRLEQKNYQFLYQQGDMLVFMDTTTYDQIELHKDFVGEDQVRFLQEGMTVVVEFHEERPIGIELPDSVVLEIVEADAVVRGQTASSSYKPARASNGDRK